MKQKTNSFKSLISEVRALKQNHNPLPLFNDLHIDALDADYQFTTSLQTLHLVSRTIENSLKAHKHRSVLYSGFQVLSHFTDYIERYARLAKYAKEIYIIGVADTKIGHIADNVHIVTKNAYTVRDNWISIVTDGNMHSALIAEECAAPNAHKYDGFYTNSEVVTEKAIKILTENGTLSKDIEYGEQKSLF